MVISVSFFVREICVHYDKVILSICWDQFTHFLFFSV